MGFFEDWRDREDWTADEIATIARWLQPLLSYADLPYADADPNIDVVWWRAFERAQIFVTPDVASKIADAV